MRNSEGRSWKAKIRRWCATVFAFAFVFLIYLASYVLCLTSSVQAQDVTATLKADSSHITIGDFLNVKLAVKFPSDFIVTMPPVADTVGSMEVVKASKIDTVIANNYKTLTQSYTLSAYDSGTYHAGPQIIIFKNKAGIVDTVFSDSVLINVFTVPVDTSKGFKAIKAPVDVPYTLSEFLPYIIAALAIIAAIAVLVIYLRKLKKKKPKVIARPRPKDAAHVWARKELKKLEEEKLWQKDEIKKYYSRLTDILRLYLEYRFGWFALESTTEEITDEISSYPIESVARKILLTVLIEGDQVKFARMIPMPDSNLKVMELAYQFINLTEEKEIKAGDKVNV